MYAFVFYASFSRKIIYANAIYTTPNTLCINARAPGLCIFYALVMLIFDVGRQKANRFRIAFDAMSYDCFDAGSAHIRDLAKIFTLRNFGDVHLHGGDTHRFERIQKRYRGVGVCTGIKDNALIETKCLLNGIDEVALVIGLIADALFKAFFSGTASA